MSKSTRCYFSEVDHSYASVDDEGDRRFILLSRFTSSELSLLLLISRPNFFASSGLLLIRNASFDSRVLLFVIMFFCFLYLFYGYILFPVSGVHHSNVCKDLIHNLTLYVKKRDAFFVSVPSVDYAV